MGPWTETSGGPVWREAGPCSLLPIRTAPSWTLLAFLSSSERFHAQPPLWVSWCHIRSPFIHSFDACLVTGVVDMQC